MQKAGKYEILRKIGTGGFGVVYEGRDPFIKRRVAIKTCTSEDEEMRQRFFREAEIAGNLEQKNIVTIFDFGFEDGVPYLVQEYLPGEDLDHKITRRDPLTLPQKLEILLQVAQGLAYAHARGVIHRDIKPGNIRVLEDARVKIMDFGIAKLADVESGLTKAGMTVGTAAYLPPEQIRGDKVDSRADIFSFGVVAYELLAYQRPFDGKTLSTLLYQILSQEPVPLGEMLFDQPERISKLVMRCLEKDAADRPPSFDAVVGELAAVLSETAGVEDTLRIARTAPLATPPAESDADALEPFAARARAALAQGDLTAAELEITLAAKKFGEGAPFRRVLGPLKKEIAGSRDRHEEQRRRGERLRSLLERARSLERQQSYEEARLALQAALEIDPAHVEARRLIDQVDGALAEAARERERAANLAERRAEAERRLAAGDLDGARETLAAAQKEHGETALADVERRLEMAARAEQIAALVAKARAELEAGEPASAAEMARRALAIDAGSRPAQDLVAAAEEEMCRQAEEAAQKRAAEERARQEDRVRRQQAVEQALGRGDFGGARTALAEAIAVHGAGNTFAGLHERLLAAERAAQVAGLVREAEARLHDADPELAVEYGRRALEIDAASRDARDVLERAQAELRRRAAAEERGRRIARADREIADLLAADAHDKAEKALARAERELGDQAFTARRHELGEARAARAREREERTRLAQSEREASEAVRAREREERERLVRERAAAQAAEREAARQQQAEVAARKDAEREAARAREAEMAARRSAERDAAREREAAEQAEREVEKSAREIDALLGAAKLDKADRLLSRALAEHGESGPLPALRERLSQARLAENEARQRAALEKASLSRARALEAAAGTQIPSGSFASPGAPKTPAVRWAIAAGAGVLIVGGIVWMLVGGGAQDSPPGQATTQPVAPAAEPPNAAVQTPPSSTQATPPVEAAPPKAEPAPPKIEPAPPAVSPAAAFVAQGRERLTAGDREAALRAFSEAARRDPRYAGTEDGFATLDREARRQLTTAKRGALDGRADTLAPEGFAAAETEAARSSSLRDRAQALRAAWRAADLYGDALRAAETRAAQIAAQPPPVQPPVVQAEPPRQESPAQVATPVEAADESEAIRAALRRYEAAYESLDVGAVRGVWPALSEADARSLQRAFSGYNRLQMTVEGCKLETSAATASATCRVSQAIDVKVGSPIRSTQQITFRLRKSGDSWTILGRSVQ